MKATGLPHGDPVTAAAWRYLHLRLHNAPPDTPMCTYYMAPGAAPKSVTGSDIVLHLRATARKICFQRLGFHAHDIGSHSLRSGGAMTLHQDHIPDSTIKITGRWRSDAFLIYLQGQVATSPRGSPRPWRQYPGSYTRCPTHPSLKPNTHSPEAHPHLLPCLLQYSFLFLFSFLSLGTC